MAGVVTPEVPATTDIWLGEGKIYTNYGEASAAVLGATRGGSKFSVDREIRDITFDGAFGPVSGLRRKTRIVPSLTVKMLELNYTNLPQCFGGMTSSDEGSYHKIIEDSDITSGDYLTNVAFVGQTLAGKYVIIIVKNALGDGKIDLALDAKDEIVSESTFTGHYDASTPTTVPYEIRIED